MKDIFPRCPKCKNRQFIGRVKSFDYELSKGITAYFCSNCLVEFDKSNNILPPYWGENMNLEKKIV